MMRQVLFAVLVSAAAANALAQDQRGLAKNRPTGQVVGRVTDETGGALPGVLVELRGPTGAATATVTSDAGEYALDELTPGTYQASFSMMNFSEARRDVIVEPGAARVDVVLHLSLTAEVTVVGKRTFANLADVENPAENLVGVAQSASQGAITARQLDVRPLMRQGEVLETVPGVIITQHSGEGKANQYFLRGFNLDHGSDFAITVAGTPVNIPTHAHSQGYSDLNFLIPELVAGMQFSKGPYFADQGDFATAGASNIPTPRAWIGRSCSSKKAPMISAAHSSPPPRDCAPGTCSSRSSCRTIRARGPSPTPTRNTTASFATARETR